MAKDGVVSIAIDYKDELNQMIRDYESALTEMASSDKLSKGMKAQFDNTIAELKHFKADMEKSFSDLSIGKVDKNSFKAFKQTVNKNFESVRAEIDNLNLAVSTINSQIKILGNGIDISKISSQFKNFQDYVQNTNNAIDTMIKKLDGQGISLMSFDDSAVNQAKSQIKEINKLLKSTDEFSDAKGSKYELFDTDQAQAELDVLARDLKNTLELIEKSESELSNFDKNSIGFEKTINQINILKLKAADLHDSIQQLMDIPDKTGEYTFGDSILISDDNVDKKVSEYGKIVKGTLDEIRESAIKTREELERIVTPTSSKAASAKMSDKLNRNSAELVTGVTIETTSSELWKKLSPILEDLQNDLNKNPVVAPVKLVVAPNAVLSEKNGEVGTISKSYSKKYQRELAKTGEDAVIDLEGVYKKTFTSIMDEAVSYSKETINKIQKIFESSPIKLHFDFNEEEFKKLSNTLLSSDSDKKIDITGQIAESKKEVNEFAEKLAEVNELLNSADSKDFSFKGFDKFAEEISKSLGQLTELQSMLKTLQNIESILARASGVSSVTDIETQWQNVSKLIENSIKLDGTFRKNVNVDKLASEYNKYLNMGGTNELSSIGKVGKLENSKNIIDTILSKVKKLNSQKVDTSSVDKADDELKSVSSTLDDVISRLDHMINLTRDIGNTFWKMFKDASVSDVDKQWSSIESKFKSIVDESGKINLSKQKKDIQELVEMYQKYSNAGGMKTPFDLTNNAETIKKINKVYEQMNSKKDGTSVTNESKNFTKVEDSVNSLTSAINTKTEAIKTEANTMELAARSEIKSIQKIIDALNPLIEKIENIPELKIPKEDTTLPSKESNISLGDSKEQSTEIDLYHNLEKRKVTYDEIIDKIQTIISLKEKEKSLSKTSDDTKLYQKLYDENDINWAGDTEGTINRISDRLKEIYIKYNGKISLINENDIQEAAYLLDILKGAGESPNLNKSQEKFYQNKKFSNDSLFDNIHVDSQKTGEIDKINTELSETYRWFNQLEGVSLNENIANEIKSLISDMQIGGKNANEYANDLLKIFNIEVGSNSVVEQQNKLQSELKETESQAEKTTMAVKEVSSTASTEQKKDAFPNTDTKLDEAVTSAKDLDKTLKQVDIPTDSFDKVLEKLDRTKSELVDIVKITKQSVSDKDGKFHDSYTLKDSRGSTEIYGINSKTDKGQILRQNIVSYDVKKDTSNNSKAQAHSAKEEWTNALKTVKEYETAVSKLNNLKASDKGLGIKSNEIAEQEKKIDDMKSSFDAAQTTIISFLTSIDKFNTLPVSSIQEVSNVIKLIQTASEGSAESVAKLEDALRNVEKVNLDNFEKEKNQKINKLSSYTDGTKYTSEFKSRVSDEIAKIQKLQFSNPNDVTILKQIDSEIQEIINDSKLLENKLVKQESHLADIISQMKIYRSENTNMSSSQKSSLNSMISSAEELAHSGKVTAEQIEQIKIAFSGLKAEISETGRTGKNFFSQIGNRLTDMNSKFVAQFLSWQDWIMYIRQAAEMVIELNTKITELAKVSEDSVSQIYADFDSYANIAKEMGSTISDTIAATTAWSKNGYNIPDSKELAEVSLLYKNVGDGINIDEANESLVSTLKGFKLEADQAEHIVDVFNKVSNNEPISSSGIGDALQRSAASFNAANTSLEKSVALVTATNSVLQDPEKVGNMWKTVSARIRGAKTELEEAGEDTDGMVESTSKLQALIKGMTGFDIMKSDGKTFKDIYDIIIGIGEKWQDLNDIDRASILESLAGKNQSNALAAAISQVDILKKAYGEATNAEGSAREENSKYQQSVQYSIDQTKAKLEELANDTLNSNFLKGLINAGGKIIDILDIIIKNVGILKPLIAGLAIKNIVKNFD